MDPLYWKYFNPRYTPPIFRYPNYPNDLWSMYAPNNTPAYVQTTRCDVPIPYNPLLGRYGTAEISLKGYVTNNSCQFGYYPANVSGQGVCCNVYGECGTDNVRLT